MRYFLAVAALMASLGVARAADGPAAAPDANTANTADGEFYGVVFGITLDKGGHIAAFRVVQVMDPHLDPKTPVNIPVPDSFIAAARKLAEAKHYGDTDPGRKQAEFYTYFLYFPAHPDRADLEPRRKRP